MLRDHPTGNYRYMPGISAFSCGTVAGPGHEIVHVTLAALLPWRDGFARIERHLREVKRPRTALCGIELRSPAPFTFDGFGTFNEGYRKLLADWSILVGEDNPIPRTNVAPVAAAPAEPSLYASPTPSPAPPPSPPSSWRARASSGIARRGPRASCATATSRRTGCARRRAS